MNGKHRDQGSGFFVGGSVIGSAIGTNNAVRGNEIIATGEAERPGVKELRSAIAALRAKLDEADSNQAVIAEAGHELAIIEDALQDGQLDAEAVPVRWKHVRKLLGPLQYSANLAQITDLVLNIFKS